MNRLKDWQEVSASVLSAREDVERLAESLVDRLKGRPFRYLLTPVGMRGLLRRVSPFVIVKK